MTTLRKRKPTISEESKRIVSEQLSIDEIYHKYDEFQRAITNDLEREKNVMVNEFLEKGEDLINEMEENTIKRDHNRNNMISYILRNVNEFSKEDLESLQDFEITTIYNTTVNNNKSFFRKFVEFFLGL